MEEKKKTGKRQKYYSRMKLSAGRPEENEEPREGGESLDERKQRDEEK